MFTSTAEGEFGKNMIYEHIYDEQIVHLFKENAQHIVSRQLMCIYIYNII